jgi:(E)-4-hydroxy-3-methyl-but-2-enyl pyrophosphate reductase
MKNTRKIILAKNAGFCFGVRRAIELAEQALEKGRRVYCLGSIIHNPQVVGHLEKKGMRFVKSIARIPAGSIFIVRSHGVAPDIIKKLEKKKVKIIDATCPFVGKAQQAAQKFFEEGKRVVIFGDKDHAEVVGINGYAANKAEVVLAAQEIRNIHQTDTVGILSQTTQKKDNFQKLVQDLKKMKAKIAVADTICNDSSKKKEEVKKIAKRVEVMIVVGGKESNNTKKLAEASRLAGAKTYHIETAAEIKPSWLKNAKKIGLAAGASTPDWIIDEVILRIMNFEL